MNQILVYGNARATAPWMPLPAQRRRTHDAEVLTDLDAAAALFVAKAKRKTYQLREHSRELLKMPREKL
jgi:hypothetical protein